MTTSPATLIFSVLLLTLPLGALAEWPTKTAETALAAKDGNAYRKEALVWATKGNAQAQVDYGQVLIKLDGEEKGGEEAARWFRKAAEQGNDEGQFDLGQVYIYGVGVPKDWSQAAFWLHKSAAQDNLDAQIFLVRLYASGGPNFPKDLTASLHWTDKAANQGSALAYLWMGQKAHAGSGMVRDDLQSFKWLFMAAVKEDEIYLPQAMYEMAKFQSKLSGADIVRFHMIKEKLIAAMGRHDANAMYHYALIEEEGLLRAPDHRIALRWFVVSADIDFGPSVVKVAQYAAKGMGLKADASLAWALTETSSDKEEGPIGELRKTLRLQLDATQIKAAAAILGELKQTYKTTKRMGIAAYLQRTQPGLLN